MMTKVRKAVITAGGWGTRFLPITKSLPKEMLPLLTKPLIQYSVEEAAACVELVIIVTAQDKSAIESYFDRSFELEDMLEQKGEVKLLEEVRQLSNMVDICYLHQKEQLGLGHAVLMAKNVIGQEPFILFLPDDLFEHRELVLKEMLEIYQRYQGSVLAVRRVAQEEVSRYGIIQGRKVADGIYQVTDLIEKPQPMEALSNLAIMGRYILTPAIFKALEESAPGKNGEIQLTDALKRLLPGSAIYAYEFEGERYDAGTPLGWLETAVTFTLKHPDIGPALRQYLVTLLKTE